VSSGASRSTCQSLMEQLRLEVGVERIMVSPGASEPHHYRVQKGCQNALLLCVPVGSYSCLEPRS
uniref:G protein gamma domain-containing protein n=1 Tax=Urocitellus parryii TaxID=9999 RepID=A0A8D2HX02_UROPR